MRDRVSLLHGLSQANCTKNKWRRAASSGRRGERGGPRADPWPGGRLDRRVVIGYSSDESLDEGSPQWVEGEGAPKHVKKQIHLTLPASPAHVTTTETFATFFINHSLAGALRGAFGGRGWSTDQMWELVAGFRRRHGRRVPLPGLCMDEDSSDGEGLELADRARVGRKATNGAGGSSGGGPGGKPAAGSGSSGAGGSGGGSGGDPGPSLGGGGAGGSGSAGGGPGRFSKHGRDDDDPSDDPNKRRKTSDPPKPARARVAGKEPWKGIPTYGGQYIGPGVRQGVVYPPIDGSLTPL